MKSKGYSLIVLMMLIAFGFMVSGCAVNLYRQSPRSKEKIKELQKEISTLEKQRREEQERFEEVKRKLERGLRGEGVSLEVGDRGLVIILSDDILFDSGKAEIKSRAYPVLDEVIAVVKSEVPDKNIGIGGHTDNVPITYSGWESNWELSTARATNVLHYMVNKGVPEDRLSATGYGEHRPIASNASEEGRARNRRVEIVILPEFAEKRQEDVSEDIEEIVK